MNFRLPPSKFKNQILTAQKRDSFHSELDLTKDAIGNDSCRTVQSNHDTIIFSCGSSGLGFVPVKQPGKFGFQHQKVSCGHISDVHVSPFVYERLVAASCTDQSVRVYTIPQLEAEEEVSSALHEFRASAGTANTPVLVCWNPQVGGILAVGSGTKLDIYSQSSGKIEQTIDVSSPIITMDWSHDGTSVLTISKDGALRIVDVRVCKIVQECKLSGSKQVVKSLPNDQWVVSSMSRMRERELNLYSIHEPTKSIKSWNFGTASTPLIPIVDTSRKIVYLLDKSGGTLRWIEMVAPYNEGAAGTSVEQSSSACLIHPFGLQVMEGEINRVMIADTKGNTVPVKITIGRKSYVEFHEDVFTPTEIQSSISAAEWLEGQNRMASMAQVNPSLISAASKGESLTKYALLPAHEKNSTSSQSTQESRSAPEKQSSPELVKAETLKQSSQAVTQSRAGAGSSSSLSAREQRKWDKEEGRAALPAKATTENTLKLHTSVETADQIAANDARKNDTAKGFEARKASPDLPDEPGSTLEVITQELDAEQPISLGRGPAPVVGDEEALEKMRARRVTPAIEAQEQELQIQSPQPQREVFREDLSSRRAEYGAPSSGGLREVFKENLGERRAEYGAAQSSKKLSTETTEEPQKHPMAPVEADREIQAQTQKQEREIYREDLGARRAEYGATGRSVQSPSKVSSPAAASVALSAREQRKWEQETKKTTALDASPAREVYREDKSARRAEYGASPTPVAVEPSKPTRTSTAEREVFREDLTARRAEYGAVTPTLSGPTTAYREITKALGKQEPQSTPKVTEAAIPYKKSDDEQHTTDSTAEELENAYAPPIEESKIDQKRSGIPVTQPEAIVHGTSLSSPGSSSKEEPIMAKAEAKSSGTKTSVDKSNMTALKVEEKDYTRKYLQGKPQHPRHSYTSLVGLNASLPNTARLIHTTPKHIAIPLAGSGGRIAIIPYNKSGRLPPLLNGFTGGAQVVDFELDRLQSHRLVSAHVDQTVKVWIIPDDIEDQEVDIDTASVHLKGMDKIVAVSLHPHAKDLLMVTTSTKIHLFDIAAGKELVSFACRGVANSCWSLGGSRIAVGKSDKSVVILEARTGKELHSFSSAHSSTRPFRLQYVGDNRLITAGFGRGSTRQLALYDANTGEILQVHDMDISPSPFALPHFDEMSNILYLIPRGSSVILPFHIMSDSFTALPQYSAADPVMGTTFLAPQDLDTREVEVARCLRLSTNEITVVGFHIPRPSGDYFHDDVYPTEVRDVYSASLTAMEWFSGADAKRHKTVDLNPENLKGASSSGIGSAGRKSGAAMSARTPIKVREPETKKPSELEEMFAKAKSQEGDEPENVNKNKNTEWE